jgi:hypothetical protein
MLAHCTLERWASRSPPLARPLEAVLPSSVESLRMVCSDNDPLWAIPTNTTLESFPLVKRHSLPKRLAMNYMLPKWIVSPRVKLTSVWCLPLVMTVNFDEWTIKMSVFSAPANNRVYKITCQFWVDLTNEHKGFILLRALLGEVISLCPMVCYWCLRCYKEWSYELE